jgi:hypothetical protein
MSNYLVVLFKNKVRRKIINKFVTLKRAKNFYDDLLKKSDDIVFDVQIENGSSCKYELGIIELTSKQLVPIYITDEMGRNIRVKLENEGMTLFEISNYKKEELLFDLQENKKIKVPTLIKKYIGKEGIKLISSINNKIIIQNDDTYNIFSLKAETEAIRFIDCLSQHFSKNKRTDCIFVKNQSVPEKKYMLDLLSEKGFDRKKMYRKSTTYSRLK